MRKVVYSASALILGLLHAAGGQVHQGGETPHGGPAPQPAYEGNSLMRSALAQQADPTSATLAQTSWFAIPKPEPRVMHKHDLVTIIVREESESTSEGKTDLSKKASLDAGIDEWVALNLSNMEIEGGAIGPNPPRVKMDGNRDFVGDGSADRRDSLITRITAEIVDIKPNETLVLQAYKRVKTEDEEVELVMSGTCRVQDVTIDNSILSTLLSDFQIEKRTTGAVRDTTKRGFVPRLLDFINPF